MPKQEGQKSKLLTLLRILEQKTDEEHLLNVPQLVELLEQQDILAERKSIYSDIDTLRSLGYDIQLRRGRGGGYWLASRTFELSELKLLVDAVQASKVVSARTSSKLIHKLEALCSDYEGTQLQRQVYVDGRPKSDSHILLYSIDALHSAINAGRMVRFRYKDGGTRAVSPTNVIENYNEIANKMNEYLVREIIYEKNQRKIQSKMLRYQINPHFLYNTLNLIASMGELSDFPEIVEITKNLSCIMQYNVKGSRFVSLKTEVEMVKAYLEIQRIRFHDCFSVEYEIERQIEQVRIVKFILQPIVENIFEHGFTMDENDNKIWIKAFKCEDGIVILVKDNGCGIDSEKREELNRILCERTRRISYIDEEEKSIGINNVNTRIKNYYGEKYGVKVNKADKGTEIQLLLGIENLEEENKDK